MPTALLTPSRGGEATQVGRRLYRKQILPVGSINYNGRRIDFSRDYLAEIKRSFDEQAYDAVPFLVATGDSDQHGDAPMRTEGEVRSLELTDDGLYALLDLTEAAASKVAQFPRLGVSARIVDPRTRADGKSWPRALAHVLATTDPRVTGMRPWQAVDLSADPATPLDFTSGQYDDDKEKLMPLSDEDRKALVAELAAELRKSAVDPVTPPAPPAGVPTPAPPAATAPAESEGEELTDEELNLLVEEALAESGEPVGASLAGDGGQSAIDLANAQTEQLRQQVADLQAGLDVERINKERLAYVNAGVPPALVDAATPLLLGAGHTLDLANGTQVQAGDVIRAVLDAAKGTVDLSGPIGTSLTAPATAERDALLAAWERDNPTRRTAGSAQ